MNKLIKGNTCTLNRMVFRTSSDSTDDKLNIIYHLNAGERLTVMDDIIDQKGRIKVYCHKRKRFFKINPEYFN